MSSAIRAEAVIVLAVTPRIVPRQPRREIGAHKPTAPMSWPLPHIHVPRGTGTPVQWMQRLKRLLQPPQFRHQYLLESGIM